MELRQLEPEPEPEPEPVQGSRLRAWCAAFGKDLSKHLQQKADSEEAEDVRKIELDLPRTLPDHPLFADPNGVGIAELRQLLYGLHAQHGEYCQGQNFVAAFLLVQAHAERDLSATGCSESRMQPLAPETTQQCLMTLNAVVNGPVLAGLWTTSLPLVQTSAEGIDTVLAAASPHLANQLEAHALQSLGSVARKWLLCAFAHPDIPFEWQVWLWDILAGSTNCPALEAEQVTDRCGMIGGHHVLRGACCAVVAVAIRQEDRLLAIATDGKEEELHSLLGKLWQELGAVSEHGVPLSETAAALSSVSSGYF